MPKAYKKKRKLKTPNLLKNIFYLISENRDIKMKVTNLVSVYPWDLEKYFLEDIFIFVNFCAPDMSVVILVIKYHCQ